MVFHSITSVSDKIYFIHIGTKEDIYFTWKSKNSPKAFIFDYSIAANAPQSEIYYHLNKGDIKIVYLKRDKLVFVIAGDISVQFQVFEALLEFHAVKFVEIYGDMLQDIFDVGTPDFFKAFHDVINEAIIEIPNQNGKIVEARCRSCQRVVYPYIRKSLIEESEDFPVPIVYMHEGHALLLYIDRDFKVRGAEIVSITG